MESKIDDKGKQEQRKKYLDGLKRYHDRGIPIKIDGRTSTEQDWSRIFEVCEDGSFYMGDYIGADQGKLMEIRFDRVYYK